MKNFAKGELQRGDDMIREIDRLTAQAIREVTVLFTEGFVKKPKNYPYAFPTTLAFHDAPAEIEQTLFVMSLKHRIRTFKGTPHANTDYALWYGRSEMRPDLMDIKTLAAKMRGVRVKGK